ncbi:MAG: neutral zinc metallopeptidase [Vicinamibacterales bacterium]
MRWESGRRSSNVEDRRGRSAGPVGLGTGGIGMVLVVLLVSWLTGTNPLTLLQLAEQGAGPASYEAPAGAPPADDAQAQFVSVVLADTEDTWGRLFAEGGQRYAAPTLVLFTGAVDSACGRAGAAVGPFYCPGDHKVYLDLSFFQELAARFDAPGDFAQAYVVAHEVGHHVQNLLGVSEEVSRRQQRAGEVEANQLSVRLELQADCFAGVWGYHADSRDLLEPGDVEEGLRAAAAIGDDELQREGQGYVRPETFTHGTSAQRVEWLRRGLREGRVGACDTFGGPASQP